MGINRNFKECEQIMTEYGFFFGRHFKDNCISLYNSFTNKEIRQKVWTPKNIMIMASAGGLLYVANSLYCKLLTIIPKKQQIWFFPFFIVAWIALKHWEKRLTQKKNSPQ